MDGFRRELKSQIIDIIITVISEKVLPDIRNTMANQHPVFREEVDHRSSRLSRTGEEENTESAWKSNSKPILTNSSKRNVFREDSDNSHTSDNGHEMMTIGHDMVTRANPTTRTVPEFFYWTAHARPS